MAHSPFIQEETGNSHEQNEEEREKEREGEEEEGREAERREGRQPDPGVKAQIHQTLVGALGQEARTSCLETCLLLCRDSERARPCQSGGQRCWFPGASL